MAVRLPLILSQPARRDAWATETIENVVAAALLVSKLDANLVGDIATIETGGTDHLCLEGNGKDLILASMHTLDNARSAWHRLGLTGTFIDCSQSSSQIRAQASEASGARRVYYFQLTPACIHQLFSICVRNW